MELTNELVEFYGILTGDGCISKYKDGERIRRAIRIDGNSLTDKFYFNHIKALIKSILNKEVTVRYRNYGNNIFITFENKQFAIFLHNKLGFPYGKKKNKLKLPKRIIDNNENLKYFLRGFFDTDGCIYFTKNNSNSRNYPIIELSTHDAYLLSKIKNILKNKGFNVIISHFKDSIKLHGKKNVTKWMKEIGSSNIDKSSKYLFWKRYRYCPKIDELNLRNRLNKIR